MMTEERLKEITEMVSYLLNETCVYYKQEKVDRGWTVALNDDRRKYFYIASFEFGYNSLRLACGIADEISEYLETPF